MNENQTPLSSITFEIEKENSQSEIIQTDENGNFDFDLNDAKQFILYINEFGYENFEEHFVSDPLKFIDIILKKNESIDLNAVNIVGQKPLLTRKIDRIEFNVENTSLQNLSAWDIVKNTPNVVAKNDELSVRGNTQILVTINDKKTMMTQDQLKQLLENTSGSDVSSVEVITNPPAKYEASGSAIINIKMKKNSLSGYKGQLYGRYHQGIYAKGMIGSSHNYNTEKWQLSGSYYFVNGEYVRKNFDIVTFEKDKSRWESDMKRKTYAKEQHLYNFAAQYNLDSLTNVQFGFNGYNNPASIGQYRVPTMIYNTENNQPISNYLTENNRVEYANNFNAYLAMDKNFGEHNLNWSNNYSLRHYTENQEVTTFLNFDHQPSENYFGTKSLQDIHLISSQLDYGWTKENFGLESGIKYSFVQNQNDLDFFENQPLTYSSEKSNRYNYEEQIFAAYISSNFKWKDWELKAGLRSETTWIKTNSTNPKIDNNKAETQIFPTIYLMRNLGENQLSLSYGKRISRPNYTFLNPSKSYYNLFSYFQGDANMKSTIIHNLNLAYTFKNWNFEAYYRYEKDPAMEISIQNPETFETVYHFTNIKNGEAFGFNFSKNFNLKPWWKLNIFGMGEYNENYYFGSDQELYQNDVFFYHLNLNTQMDLDKAKTWNLTLGYVYNSNTIQGSFDISSSQNTYLILNKKLWDKKLEIGLIYNDIFKTDNNRITTNYADQNQSFKDLRETNYFMLNLRYNFGNQKVKEAKSIEKTDEQNRI